MKKEVETILINARLEDIKSDIASILNILNIAEFADFQLEHVLVEKMRLKELKKKQKTLQEALNE